MTVDMLLTPEDRRAMLSLTAVRAATFGRRTRRARDLVEEPADLDAEGDLALPEYYPTRVERELLERHTGETAAASGADVLVESQQPPPPASQRRPPAGRRARPFRRRRGGGCSRTRTARARSHRHRLPDRYCAGIGDDLGRDRPRVPDGAVATSPGRITRALHRSVRGVGRPRRRAAPPGRTNKGR